LEIQNIEFFRVRLWERVFPEARRSDFQKALRRTALGAKNAGNGAEIERIGDE